MGAPKPPDPVKTAEAQADMNRETAITQYGLGATNQYGPFGSLEYNQIGEWADGTPRFSATQSLNPEVQGLTDNLIGTASRLSSSLGGGLDLSGLPARSGNISAPPSLRQVGEQLGYSGPGVQHGVSSSSYSPRYASGEFGDAGQIQTNVGADDWSKDRGRVEEAVLSRVEPQVAADRERVRSELVAAGVRPGTVAFDRGMDELNRAATDRRFQAVLAGGEEQSRLAGLELAQGDFRNRAQAQNYGQLADRAKFAADVTGLNNRADLDKIRADLDVQAGNNAAQQQGWAQNLADRMYTREGIQANNDNLLRSFGAELQAGNFNNANRAGALEEMMAARSVPINEMIGVLNGTQIANQNFVNTPQPGVNGVDYTGLVNQQYQAQLQNHQGMMSGLFGLGGSLLGLFSDRRLKTEIRRVGTADNGLPIYSYRYKSGGPVQIGFMADEVAKVRPEAVGERDGYLTVDYERAAA